MIYILGIIGFVFILTFELDLMDITVFDRVRNKGFFSVHQEPDFVFNLGFYKMEFRFDFWHIMKWFFLFTIFYKIYGWSWYLGIAYGTSFILHEFVFYHNIFKKHLKNNK